MNEKNVTGSLGKLADLRVMPRGDRLCPHCPPMRPNPYNPSIASDERFQRIARYCGPSSWLAKLFKLTDG